jgi:hypothetical protein
MSVRVDLQGISAGYFIDRRGALGVMTSQYTLLEYQTAGFSPGGERVLFEQCLRIADSEIFCGFCAKGASVLTYSALDSSRIRLRKKVPQVQCKEDHHRASTKFESSYLLPMIKHP